MKCIITTLTLFTFISCSSQVPKDAKEVMPLNVGDEVQNTEIRNIDGELVETDNLFKKEPTVLVIYRGGWCPYCNKQLSRLRKITDEIDELGYQLIAVSPDKPEELIKSMEKNGIKEYKLYSDSKLNLAKELGIAFKVNEDTIEKYKEYGIDLERASGESHMSLPVPAIFVLDRNSEVKYRFYEPNYKVRLDENKLIQELNKL